LLILRRLAKVFSQFLEIFLRQGLPARGWIERMEARQPLSRDGEPKILGFAPEDRFYLALVLRSLVSGNEFEKAILWAVCALVNLKRVGVDLHFGFFVESVFRGRLP
jgi:hypothetical protein